jgi:hypothetical protein
MISEQIAVALSSAISLMGIWALLLWLYRDYRVDLFRQRMFTLRDELFDLARSGAVSFDHPAYGILRSTINGFIRFGDRATILDFLMFAVVLQPADVQAESFKKQWESNLATLPGESEAQLIALRTRMHDTILRQVFAGSPVESLIAVLFFSPAILLAIAILVAKALLKHVRAVELRERVRRAKRQWFDRADSTALAIGSG